MKPMTVFRISFLPTRLSRSWIVSMVIAGMVWHQGNLTASAETWSDSTGKFQIEAEFVSVQGSDVVLKKTDGQTLRVPIAKLSVESRDLAKQFYEKQRLSMQKEPRKPSPAQAVRGNEALVASPPNRTIQYSPPVPPATPQMLPFPDAPDLQTTVDFVIDQILGGHPEVLWEALPQEMREKLDDPELRAALVPVAIQQNPMNEAMADVTGRILEVLINKKEYVLNSTLVSQVPPEMLPIVRQGYDPAMGLAYEITMFPTAPEELMGRPFSELIGERGPRIGAHLHALAMIAPPGMIDQIRSQIDVTQTDDTHGTVTTPDNQGGTQTTPFMKIGTRWLPEDLVEKWNASKDTLQEDLTENMVKMKESSDQTTADAGMMIQMFSAMAASILEPLANAQSQAEFDQILNNAMAAMGGMGGPLPGAPGNPGELPLQP